MRNEQTSPEIAAIAGRVLASLKGAGKHCNIGVDLTGAKRLWHWYALGISPPRSVTVDDLRALAASCLTQAPDKPAKRRKAPPVALSKPKGRKRAAKRGGAR